MTQTPPDPRVRRSGANRPDYAPIERYGIIGDMRTAALVGTDGSIDWCCMPRFDAPSVFAALLDHERGGRFRIGLDAVEVSSKQFYMPGTNVLVTRFLADEGVGEVTDYMPLGTDRRTIIRSVKAVRGDLRFVLHCCPAFDYARAGHDVDVSAGGASFQSAGAALVLRSPVPLRRRGDAVEADFPLHQGQGVTFVLEDAQADAPSPEPIDEEEAERLFRATVDWWQGWLATCTYAGRWRESVERSALALKLLTYEPTGAIVAAPTCSLPEELGGGRNWDYRYTWIRDAAFTLYALLRIGFTEEAGAFMRFLTDRCGQRSEAEGPLQVMYGIDGRAHLPEERLEHLDGYRGSRPVRIGNGAYDQLQLDIYGELLDAVYLYNKYGAPISFDLWQRVRGFVDWVCDHWDRRDEGLWEVRGGRKHFVYSKVMCWVAVDRGLRLASKRSFPADRERWLAVRDAIYEEIMERGWSEDRRAFVQHYEDTTLDASSLIMPLVFFMSPVDPRMLRTLDAILQPPDDGGLLANSLVYRYNTSSGIDGLSGEEGTFNMCTFWLVEALTRASVGDPARLERARLIFEQMLGYANHVGLYGEQTGRRGEALGNFPQAFTHLSLISAAFNLDRVLDASDGS